MIFHDATGLEYHPFRGNVPFRPADAGHFFGRGAESRELGRLWSQRPLTVLTGDTGCGKTSLLQAGVLTGLPYAQVGRLHRPGPPPIAALPSGHNPWTSALLASLAPHETAASLAGTGFTDFVGRRLRRAGGPLLVAIDQFEDFFQGGPYRALYREPFMGELADALDRHSELRLLIVVRTSHGDDLLKYGPPFDRAARLTLGPLSTEAAADAITRPLEQTSRRFTPQAAAQLVDELGGDAIEPVALQAVCTRLWAKLPPAQQVIGPEEIFWAADVPHALAEFTRAVLADVGASSGRSPEELRAWAHAAFADGHPAKPGPQETAGMSNHIVNVLENEHLLRSVPDEGVRLLHDGFREALGGPSLERTERAGAVPHIEAAASALLAGDLDTARRLADRTLRLAGPESLDEASALLGDLRFERARDEWALAVRSGSVAPDDRIREHLGEALSWYWQALRRHADMGRPKAAAQMFAAIGQAHAERNEFTQAVRALEEARGLLPRDPAVGTELARLLWRTDHRKQAMTEINGVLRNQGDQPGALRARGEFHAELEHAEDALRDLRRVSTSAWPGSRAAYAFALATLGRLHPEDAATELDAIVTAAPFHGPALLLAARVESLSGAPEAAATLAGRAISANRPPLSPEQEKQARRLQDRAAPLRGR
ncbi:tetratricopeptide repeat protein [Actinomadura sp. 7K534]|uniref:nSTAND1 domain-containing NTPase n=1 Tax=Actinomadura sp. 7K534 TaxID=2530366 RepID=UPI0010448C29|nr:tetratricopeptide repeat protein [Actinomadura sp. 7K534]TDB91990.1 ATP-binding protein [Actinomadura sp. 7K534]